MLHINKVFSSENKVSLKKEIHFFIVNKSNRGSVTVLPIIRESLNEMLRNSDNILIKTFW